MRNNITKILLAITALSLLKISSCTPESCFEETMAYVKANLYQSSTDKNVAPESLTLYGAGIDTNKIYDNSNSTRQALIPLNPSADSCTFIILINSETDTLVFWYDSFAHLISKECGYTYFHSLDSLTITTNAIDTVIINNIYVTTNDAENIRLYY